MTFLLNVLHSSLKLRRVSPDFWCGCLFAIRERSLIKDVRRTFLTRQNSNQFFRHLSQLAVPKKDHPGVFWPFGKAIKLLVLLIGCGSVHYIVLNNNKKESALKCYCKTADTVAVSGGNDHRKHFNFIADVVEKTAPAVVYIEIKDVYRYSHTGQPVTVSNGSGFIIESDGLILTNAHVVNSRRSNLIIVKLHNGTEYYGKIEDIDVGRDLATVRIQAKNLPTLKLGTSRNLRPGEWVAAIGSPLSLSNTITTGVVSSVARGSKELGLPFKDMDYIQTDAAITFGNSGGPLVNLDGEAVGINSMKVTAGISFAIPADNAKAFLESTKEKHKGSTKTKAPKRCYMGITMLTLSPEVILELQQRNLVIPSFVTHGVLVWKVVAGSPAENGGLLVGDVVTHVNSKPVYSAKDIYDALECSKHLEMHVVRKHNSLKLTVIPEE